MELIAVGKSSLLVVEGLSADIIIRCSKDCKLCGYCGDGKLDDAAGETCDLGYLLNGAPGQSCSYNCTSVTVTYSCGNGIVEPGEECDDGKFKNGKKGSKCGTDCKWAETCVCGNGITEGPTEECDDGDLNGSKWSKCTKDCTLKEPCGKPNPPRCGDGRVQYPEVCDLGWLNGQPGSNVSLFPRLTLLS